MPRRFEAPIPIFRLYRFDARDPVDDCDVRDFLKDRIRRGPEKDRPLLADALALDEGSDEWRQLKRFLEAGELAQDIDEVRRAVLRAARSFGDALKVDDYFQIFIDPAFEDDLSAFFDEIDSVADDDTVRQEEFFKHLEQWLEQRAPRWYRGLRRASVSQSLGNPKVKGPPCWHSKEHKALTKGGIQRSVSRRAATWGTYIVSWIVGSETLAVRLWNKFVLPADLRWGDGRSEHYAVKKYIQAKKRLERDLQSTSGHRFVPDWPNVHKPYPPLRPELASTLEGVVEAFTRRRLRALGGEGVVILDAERVAGLTR
jgi:hypothetical protein